MQTPYIRYEDYDFPDDNQLPLVLKPSVLRIMASTGLGVFILLVFLGTMVLPFLKSLNRHSIGWTEIVWGLVMLFVVGLLGWGVVSPYRLRITLLEDGVRMKEGFSGPKEINYSQIQWVQIVVSQGRGGKRHNLEISAKDSNLRLNLPVQWFEDYEIKIIIDTILKCNSGVKLDERAQLIHKGKRSQNL